MTVLKITRIPQLNSIVLKQEGGRFFISTPNSFIIDKDGLMKLLYELIKLGFIAEDDTEMMYDFCKGWNDERRKSENANKKNSSNTSIG